MPEESLYRVEERLDLINRLKTKYGDTIEKILAYCEEKKERLEVLSNYEEYLEQLEKNMRCAVKSWTLWRENLQQFVRKRRSVLQIWQKSSSGIKFS